MGKQTAKDSRADVSIPAGTKKASLHKTLYIWITWHTYPNNVRIKIKNRGDPNLGEVVL